MEAAPMRVPPEQMSNFLRYLSATPESRPETFFAAIKESKSIEMLDASGTRFKMNYARGAPIFFKIVNENLRDGDRVGSEAFIWWYLSRNYPGPPVPATRSERFRDGGRLLNLSEHAHTIALDHSDALEVFELLSIRLENAPRTGYDEIRYRAEEEDQAAQPPYDFDEDEEERREIDPVFRMRKKLTAALGTDEEREKFAIIATEGGAIDAFAMIQTGNDPVEDARLMIIQLLSSLDSFYFIDGFVHGDIDLQKVDVRFFGSNGLGGVTYETIDEDVDLDAKAATPGQYPVFSFRDLREAHLSRRIARDLENFGEGGSKQKRFVRWVREWHANPLHARSHRLDQHALGIRTVEPIAWRLANTRDSPEIEAGLRRIARYCIEGLMLAPRELSRGSHNVYGRSYTANLRRIYEIWRDMLLKLLSPSASGEDFGDAFFTLYEDVTLKKRGAPDDEEPLTLASKTSDAVEAAKSDVLQDVTFFVVEAVGEHAETSRDYWKDPFFFGMARRARRDPKKRRDE